MIIMHVYVEWIREECGGRTEGLGRIGLKPMIRWQRYVREWMSLAWDVHVIAADVDPQTRCGMTELEVPPYASLEDKFLVEGEEIELLDGSCVIAVGKIRKIQRN